MTLRRLRIFALWALAAAMVFSASLFAGSSVYAYNDEGNLPCVWEYEEGDILRPPYREHPFNFNYSEDEDSESADDFEDAV